MIFNLVNQVWEGLVSVMGIIFDEMEFALNCYKIEIILGATLY